jgi:hypothetical protein
MNFPRLLIVLLLAAVLLLIPCGVYSVGVANAAQTGRSAHAKKPTQFHYVCPMHENVTSKTGGTCPKCKMKLVRKPIVKEPTTGSN